MSDGVEQSVRKFTDNAFMIAFARVFMPVALGVIGFFMVTTLSDIKAQISSTQSYLTKVSEAQQQQAIDLATVKVRVDDTSTNVKDLSSQVTELRQQVRALPQISRPH